MTEDAIAAPGALATPVSAGRARRRLVDAVARRVVIAGGLATIASIIAILVFIAVEVVPLFEASSALITSTLQLPADTPLFAPATEEYREIMEVITGQGAVRFLNLSDGSVVQEIAIPSLVGQTVVAATRAGRDHVLLATAAGQLVAVRLPFDVRREEGKRVLQPRVVQTGAWQLSTEGSPPALLAASVPSDDGVTVVFAAADGVPTLVAIAETKNVFGEVKHSEARRALPLNPDDKPVTIAVDSAGRRAYIGSTRGALYEWDLSDKEQSRLVDVVDATGHADVGVTALGFLNGDQSIIVGDAAGHVSVWFPVRDAARESAWRLQRVHDLRAHHGAVSAIASSPRDKGFLTADVTGQVLLHHATTEQTLLELPRLAGPVAALVFSPKADGGVGIDKNGKVTNWEIRNEHPEITLQALFGKLWYEGYEQPAYVWQSTGGTDDFEPKFSLVPLILGTMKGTLYALLFAVPIAVLGALYTSQFSHPTVRNVVKPTVEIMAALPSVVLGFFAGLWLAPALETQVPAILAMFVVIPAMVFAAGAAWHALPARFRSRLRPGVEALLLVPLIIFGVQLCLWANQPLEQLLFNGNFPVWLLNHLGARFDQRNCLVVGFAMGFAVIPIIFTISEDALANVPPRLVSASLALGATPWQTAVRVVLPTASPGIFSAIMVGFGRAVGETMIVLMATGNTPVLDWSIFTGMRTLSANIAVEIPEAPHGSTLYRLLFLAALLLFFATFVVNTAAELVRLRLRRRYQQL